jgi:hypothetical protein
MTPKKISFIIQNIYSFLFFFRIKIFVREIIKSSNSGTKMTYGIDPEKYADSVRKIIVSVTE